MTERPCDCGSGEPRRALKDGYGIFLTYACDRCEAEKLKKFRPDIMTHYVTDDRIEED